MTGVGHRWFIPPDKGTACRSPVTHAELNVLKDDNNR